MKEEKDRNKANALRMVIGKNFEEYCVYHEEEWCKKTLEALDWLTNAADKPRKVEELLPDESFNCRHVYTTS